MTLEMDLWPTHCMHCIHTQMCVLGGGGSSPCFHYMSAFNAEGNQGSPDSGVCLSPTEGFPVGLMPNYPPNRRMSFVEV